MRVARARSIPKRVAKPEPLLAGPRPLSASTGRLRHARTGHLQLRLFPRAVRGAQSIDELEKTETEMKLTTLVAAAALTLATATPALAQDGVAVGAKIYGSDGAEVGTIERIEGANVLVNTGSLTAALPVDTLGEGTDGPTIGWTRAELEAAVNAANQEAAEKLAAALVEGAEVYSTDNVRLGTITAIEDDLVVVELGSGPASLPKTQMAMQADKVTFLATAAALEAAVAAQGGD
jgi:hypothetical protein